MDDRVRGDVSGGLINYWNAASVCDSIAYQY